MAGSILGGAVQRIEDPDLITGEAKYVDDLAIPGALSAAFVRAVVAHGRITVDAEDAKAMPGVVAVLTGADLGLGKLQPPGPFPEPTHRPVLADGVVRFAGEPIALVVAETRAQAVDAAEAVDVEVVEDLGAVVDPFAAQSDDAPVLFPEHGSNVLADTGVPDNDGDDFFAGADVVVKQRIVNQRVQPAPLETDAIAAVPAEDGRLTLWLSTQAPHGARGAIAGVLGLEAEQVRVVAPSVGGGFGAKITPKSEHFVVAAAARQLDRPIKYVETRSENMATMWHGRDQVQDIELGATSDGKLVGLRGTLTANIGAYPYEGTFLPSLTVVMSCGVYELPKVALRVKTVFTNTTPISAYRGAGRPEATAMIERAMDMLADELDLDPAELRRRNFIPPESFPHTTVTHAAYDSGEYAKALDALLGHAEYDKLRAEQEARRSNGDARQLGLGLCAYVEMTGPLEREFGSVEVAPDGTVTVRSGVSPHGQGHHTALTQLVSGVLKVPMDQVKIVTNDTDQVPRGVGTFGSRSLQLGGTAAYEAGQAVVEKARQLAAEALEVAVEDVVQLDDGRIGVVGAPDRALDLGQLAEMAADSSRLPEGMEPGLSSEHDFVQGAMSFPFGAHLSVVEVDTETGHVRMLRHITVDDCGMRLNPMLVEGQVHGGIAQGAAQALFEGTEYDESGNLLTSSFGTYRFPSAAELPSYEPYPQETASPLNPLGLKGIGEAGTIGATPAIQNAVVDAIRHLGVKHVDMPLTPARVWEAVQNA
jgi:carbon-monoxide dehydrogenase large subunit